MSLGDPVPASAPALPVKDPATASANARDTVVDDLDHPQSGAAPHDPTRRALLASVSAAYAVSFITPAMAAPTADAADQAFLAASKILTGRASLDPAQASRLYDALLADDPQFAEGVQALVAILDQQNVDLSQLQHVLDNEHSLVAALPRKIVAAWYTGIVGEGEKARCITFETALANVIVSDKLKPPSYCYGAPGSWVEKPA